MTKNSFWETILNSRYIRCMIESTVDQRFTQRLTMLFRTLLLVEGVLWLLWIGFDVFYALDLLSVLLPLRLFFALVSFLSCVLLWKKVLPLQFAKYLFALPPLWGVVFMFHIVPEDALAAYFLGAITAVVGVYLLGIFSLFENLVISSSTILLLVLLYYFIGVHDWQILLSQGGLTFISVMLLSVAVAYMRFRSYSRELATSLLLEQKNEELNNAARQLELKNHSLESALKERETLLQEIHHRVKNNLQIVVSLLRLQQQQVGIRSSADLLELSQNRLKTMSILHEILYASDTLSEIDLSEYVHALIQHYRSIYYDSDPQVRFALDLPSASIGIDQLVPCGLIINEAVTNSMKYAFEEQAYPVIRIEAKSDGDDLRVVVSDNGSGFDLPNQREDGHIGLPLMKGLTQQLKGHIEFHSAADGTQISFNFPIVAK